MGRRVKSREPKVVNDWLKVETATRRIELRCLIELNGEASLSIQCGELGWDPVNQTGGAIEVDVTVQTRQSKKRGE